jgi:hypothetical protein
MFSLTIDTENAAFARDPSNEIRRILLELANRIEPCPTGEGRGNLRDLNGNTVGRWELAPDEDPRALESDEPPYGSFPEERGSGPDLAGDVADALSGPAGEELGRRP